MKKFEGRGGKASVLWGVPDNPPPFSLVLEFLEEHFEYYGVSVRNF